MIDKFTLLKIVSTKSGRSEPAFPLLQLLVSPLTSTVTSINSLLDLVQFLTPWRQRQPFGVNSCDNFNIGVNCLTPQTSALSSISLHLCHNPMITSFQLLAPHALQQISAPTLIWRCCSLVDHSIGNFPCFSYLSITSVYNRMIEFPYGLTRITWFRVKYLYIASRNITHTWTVDTQTLGIFLVYIRYPYPKIELL